MEHNSKQYNLVLHIPSTSTNNSITQFERRSTKSDIYTSNNTCPTKMIQCIQPLLFILCRRQKWKNNPWQQRKVGWQLTYFCGKQTVIYCLWREARTAANNNERKFKSRRSANKLGNGYSLQILLRWYWLLHSAYLGPSAAWVGFNFHEKDVVLHPLSAPRLKAATVPRTDTTSFIAQHTQTHVMCMCCYVHSPGRAHGIFRSLEERNIVMTTVGLQPITRKNTCHAN